MKYKIVIPLFLTAVLTGLWGLYWQIPTSNLSLLLLYSCLFEFGCFLLANKGLQTPFRFSQVAHRFGLFFRHTWWVDLFLIVELIIRISTGSHPDLIFFYGHIFIFFNTIGYTLCISKLELKKN